MSENISKLSGRIGKRLEKNLFKQITEFGRQNAVPTKQDMEQLATDYNVGKATIYGSSTFYEFLSEEHLSKKAYVCNGSACLCAGTQQEVTETLAKQVGADQVGHITCLGRCHEANAFQVDGRNYSGDAITQIDQIMAGDKSAAVDHYGVYGHARENVLTQAGFSDLNAFKKTLQQFLTATKVDSLQEIKTSNLRGRGGAGFPTGIKWESCQQVPGDEKYVVCNADEGDPGAFSDRYLMEHQPYRVLFGMMACGWLIGANDGVLYIRAEYPESIERIQQLIDELHAEKLLGKNILGSGFDFEFSIIDGAGAYICGEETALLASIEGRRAEVDVRPPFPTVEGLFKKPTVVNNVETFAAIEGILSIGSKQYAAMGNGKSTGTKLISLDAGFHRPGIYEVEMGEPLSTVIHELAGGFVQPTKALHIGGPLGGLVPTDKIEQLNVDFESFSANGFLLGHASVVCLPQDFPIIDYIEHLFAFTAAESCGKCFPCRLGSTRGKEMVQQAVSGEKLMNQALLNDLLSAMKQGSLCALGGGLPLPILNALEFFGEELTPFFEASSADNKIQIKELHS